MSKKFTEYNNLDLSQINKDVLQRWDKEDVFRKSLEIREGAPSFVFYEGPPSANGMPGIHHVIARSIKDIFCRYKTMKGYLVKRKAGWDTHGLPVELGVEKALGITKEDIGKTISVAEYNAACRKDVMKYTKEWEDLTRKMGYWVDMDDPYITYDNHFIETLWYLLKELYKKGLLYKGYTIQPYSPAAGTGLSTHELNQPGCYRDVKDLTCVAMFKIIKNEETAFGISQLRIKNSLSTYILAWTTTPWTLPSNTALCVGPEIIYSCVQTVNPSTNEPCVVVLAKDRVAAYFGEKKIEDFTIIKEISGKELAGIEYEQLIPFVKPGGNAFKIITGDFVTTEDGTGIVHIAPTFGADDDRVGKQNGIVPMLLTDKNGKQVPMVDLTGKFYKIEDLDKTFVKNNVNVELYKNFAGKFVKDAYIPLNPLKGTFGTADSQSPLQRVGGYSLDLEICIWLQEQGLLFKKEKHTHNYPHCWRTDKPVLYYPLDSWFIRTTACRERMIELNNTINWKPQSTGTGRFGKWLENLQDWNLSRSRYWGTPLPIWRTEDGTEEKCIGSIAELTEEINKSVAAGLMDENPNINDLHRPFVDEIVLISENGKPMRRESDLIDVWFDSGAMPFAQLHYPFENKDLVDSKSFYPADFISEGVDQTRGWFFTLHAISAMIKESVAFKSVISTGLVLDKNGNKMSKRLGNAVDPFETIEKYGSDPLRWYMITNASPWDNLKFDIEGVEEARRKFFGTLYNTYSFFALYANVDGFEYKEQDIPFEERPEIDRWILSLLNTLVKEVDEFYSTYEPTRAGRAINDFVNDNLSNWYVRLNRKRFWGGKMDADKLSAYQTLYICLETVTKLMAPIAPFYADKLFLDLVNATKRENFTSVHLADFPVCNEALINKDLEERMQIAQTISSMVLALRRKVNIKVRQPLSSIMVPVLDAHQKEAIEAVCGLILNEVNIKEIKYVDNADGVLIKKIKPDFKKLGPRYGKIMKDLAAQVAGMTQAQILQLEQNGQFNLQVGNESAEITLADVEIVSEDIPGWLVANEGKLTVALDITITGELRKEGIARELVNRIQNIRKANGFEIIDRINVTIQPNEAVNEAISTFNDYIKNQVLADNVISAEIQDGIELDLDDFKLLVKVEKV